MIPDDPASHPPRRDDAGRRPHDTAERPGRGRSIVMILAVAFAVVGLLSLAAILATAFVQGTVWPGFVLASYFCLPIAFLLMVALVVWSVVGRRRT
ncbi:hypothetical protein PTW37_02650 [Arthrobacter agilis]|uniref:hypothetical protein n=1 Tax=Arthrobacter agilis TaxID=37921 RepID=UPI002365750B|nr:hypothetical protein [Arthrobacter agilis]WDF33841.1 hypothetical protein PTW37_02650 [Arthrobacter agilis]